MKRLSAERIVKERVKAHSFITRGLEILLDHSQRYEELAREESASKKVGLSNDAKKAILKLDKLGKGQVNNAVIASAVSGQLGVNVKPKQVAMFLAHHKNPDLRDKMAWGREKRSIALKENNQK